MFNSTLRMERAGVETFNIDNQKQPPPLKDQNVCVDRLAQGVPIWDVSNNPTRSDVNEPLHALKHFELSNSSAIYGCLLLFTLSLLMRVKIIHPFS